MPRAFTEREKEHIREQLKEKGKQYLATHGIRKTTVEDLTRAVGISKGAFYQFYGTKEELFFEVLENVDHEIRNLVFNGFEVQGLTYRASFVHRMKQALELIESHPMMGRFNNDDFMHLMRTLPEEKLAAHMKRDDEDFSQLVEEWKQGGYFYTDKDTKSAVAALKSFFYLAMQKQEIGPEYPLMMDTMLDMAAHYFVKEQ